MINIYFSNLILIKLPKIIPRNTLLAAMLPCRKKHGLEHCLPLKILFVELVKINRVDCLLSLIAAAQLIMNYVMRKSFLSANGINKIEYAKQAMWSLQHVQLFSTFLFIHYV